MSKILILLFAIFMVAALVYFLYVAYARTVKPKKEQILTQVIEEYSPAIADGSLMEDIGIETLGGVFTPILPKGTKLPCRVSNVFSTAHDNQEFLSISLYRGKKDLVKENLPLGEFEIRGIPPAPKGIPEIKITLGARDQEIFLEVAHKFGENVLSIRRL
jgi:molecular chaperone DnaK (HSP70)